MTESRTVACPHCGTPVRWTPAARWRPFCSERCKMIDLGAWASEAYRVPVREAGDSGAEDPGATDQAEGAADSRGSRQG